MNSNDQHPQHDLVGGPFAVIESDPGNPYFERKSKLTTLIQVYSLPSPVD